MPVRPTHWLGSGVPAPALELAPVLPEAEPEGSEFTLPPIVEFVVPPAVEPVVPPTLEFGPVVLAPELVEPTPVEPALPPLVCAHEAPATPTSAAATAAAIAFTITI